MTINGWKVSDEIVNEIVYFFRTATKAGFEVDRVIHWYESASYMKETSWYDLKMWFKNGDDKIEIKFRPVREGHESNYKYSLITFGDEKLTDPEAIKFIESYKKEPRAAHLNVAEFFMNYVLKYKTN